MEELKSKLFADIVQNIMCLYTYFSSGHAGLFDENGKLSGIGNLYYWDVL